MNQSNRKARRARQNAERRRNRGHAHTDARGRVHLVLHRDSVSGTERVELRAPVFNEGWQNDMLRGTANTARAILRDKPSLERVVELALNAMAGTSKLADGFLTRAPKGSVACHAGCDHCCYQSVGVTPPEALAIFDHLKSTLSSSKLADLAAHISELYEKTHGLSAAERFSPDYPCPFLEAGRCSIYDVRPLSCRGMNSLDAAECAARLRDPAARAEFLSNGTGGHCYMEPIRGFHAISAGLQLSLSELYHLDMRPLDLIAVMQLLLTGSEVIAEQWIGGVTCFESALGSDSSDNPYIGELSGRGV